MVKLVKSVGPHPAEGLWYMLSSQMRFCCLTASYLTLPPRVVGGFRHCCAWSWKTVIIKAMGGYQGRRNGRGGCDIVYNVMGVFADDVMESSSLIRWCNFTFCSYLCGYAVMMSCMQQLSASQYSFLHVC